MTNEQILKKAITKADENGLPITFLTIMKEKYDKKRSNNEFLDLLMWGENYYPLIFSSVFAVVFWGEELVRYGETKEEYIKKAIDRHEFGKHSWAEDFWNREPKMYAWQYHLQQMVLEPEPLKYLEKFLEAT